MRSQQSLLRIVLASVWALSLLNQASRGGDQPPLAPAYRISRDSGHPWRPPFGLERIGQPIVILIEAAAQPEPGNYFVTAFASRKQGASYPVSFSTKPPYSARVTLDRDADQLVLSRDRVPPEKPLELARHDIRLPDFEAEAIARPDEIVNPVNLGTILVPSGWLLLGPGQSAKLETAAISRAQGLRAHSH